MSSKESKSGCGCCILAAMFITGVFAPLPLCAKILLILVMFECM